MTQRSTQKWSPTARKMYDLGLLLLAGAITALAVHEASASTSAGCRAIHSVSDARLIQTATCSIDDVTFKENVYHIELCEASGNCLARMTMNETGGGDLHRYKYYKKMLAARDYFHERSISISIGVLSSFTGFDLQYDKIMCHYHTVQGDSDKVVKKEAKVSNHSAQVHSWTIISPSPGLAPRFGQVELQAADRKVFLFKSTHSNQSLEFWRPKDVNDFNMFMWQRQPGTGSLSLTVLTTQGSELASAAVRPFSGHLQFEDLKQCSSLEKSSVKTNQMQTAVIVLAVFLFLAVVLIIAQAFYYRKCSSNYTLSKVKKENKANEETKYTTMRDT